MSVFGDIMSAIFGRAAAAAPATSDSASKTEVQATPNGTAAASSPGQTKVDVAAVLDALAKQKKQKLIWRKSIVDLMKLLDLDSSAAARKHLADELHYQGDKKDSARMNIWLHKQVMIKLAENGGKVPDDLKR